MWYCHENLLHKIVVFLFYASIVFLYETGLFIYFCINFIELYVFRVIFRQVKELFFRTDLGQCFQILKDYTQR
ncbi:hypothetical protein SAMN02745781_01236 [Vibrio gazogenes DSM 21264]|uniref:Uncharacterized protein n=1 Tax=Vibrio gazogenes DSM 21264 = NBRC 103151 TaxID=1123492 RepID=A0A1M4Y010_VIBGA|nr:hypothetical protein SAMN02745781_01236 [Vibrio gazogenes DSM 21264] [Vibrio gazogenes DSM 21264 = NBRC 103151]SJN56326.1 hypothetical protein BQ6471_01987 [Vibrio gazogenes]